MIPTQERLLNKTKRPGAIERTGVLLWNFFASLKLTVFLFSFIAAASVLGTFLPDRIGLIKFLHGKSKWVHKLFEVFDLFDIYYSWWFVFFIILLGINLVCCSFERLPAVIKIVLKKPSIPSVSKIDSFQNKKEILVNKSFSQVKEQVEEFFKSKRMKIYSLDNEKGFSLTAEKGRYSRLGVYLAHLGFLLLIIGGVIGTMMGFSGVIEIPENQTSNIVTLFKNRGEIELDFDLTCSSFQIKRYDNSQVPKSYESEIIFNKGKPQELKGIVKVNHPLRYNGIKFIQSGYGRAFEGKLKISAYDIKTNIKKGEYELGMGETIVLPDGKTKFTFFSFRPNFQISSMNLGETFIGFILKDKLEIPVALPVNAPGFDKHRQGDFYLVPGEFQTKYYTSLQVNKDPGVYIVYLGFFFLSIGIFVSFFMKHHSFYLILNKEDEVSSKIFCASGSNKNKNLKDELVFDFYEFITKESSLNNKPL